MLGILLLCVVVGWLNTSVGEVELRLWTIDIEAKDVEYENAEDLIVSDGEPPWLEWGTTATLTEGTAADPASGVNDRPICRLTLKMTGKAENLNKKIIAEACLGADKVETFFKCGVIKGGETKQLASVNWSEEKNLREGGSGAAVGANPGKAMRERVSSVLKFFGEAHDFLQDALKTVFNFKSDTVCRESSKVFTPDERQKEVERLWDAAIEEGCLFNIQPMGSKANSQVFQELRPNAFCLKVLVFDPTKFKHQELKTYKASIVLSVFSQDEKELFFTEGSISVEPEFFSSPSGKVRVSKRSAKRMNRKFRERRKRRRNKKHVPRRRGM